MLKVLDAKVVNVKYKMRRRGSALLVVVVLVLMLAMMGTAFLMTVRISRDQISGTGSSIVILPEADYWPNVPNVSNELDARANDIRAMIANDVQRAVHNGTYRQPGAGTEDFVVSPDDTEFLAARAPTLLDATRLNEIRWDAITVLSGAGGFASPVIGPALGTNRLDLIASAYRVPYPAPFDAIPTMAGKTRIFPAFTDGTNYYMAADADGDGIADAGLFLLPATGTVPLKDGTDHPVTYWGGVRIVDNAGAVNVNTAWRSTADRLADGTPVPPGSYLSAYLGAFRPNVGLYELLRGVNVATSRIAPDGDVNADLILLDLTRMGNITNASAIMVEDAGPDVRTDAVYITQGDAIEHQLVRRLDAPGYNYAATPAPYATVPGTGRLGEDLAYHNALLNPNIVTSVFRNTLRTPFVWSPNYSDDLRKRAGFRYFGANQSDFWYHTLYNTDSSTTVANPYVGTRVAFFDPANASNRPNNPIQINEQYVRKTVRHHLVDTNPISTAVADPITAFAALPASVKDTGGNSNLMPEHATETPVKANVNTATFGELWKAYWSVFASGTANPPQAKTAARRGSLGATTWNVQAQLLTRAALAAVNTLTARNPELAYGTYMIPSGEEEHARAESRTFTYGAYDVTVYGVRKQPFITEVLIQRDENGVTYVGVELFNPYRVALRLDGYRFASLTGNALSSTVAEIPAGTTIGPGEHLVIEDGVRPTVPNSVNVDSTSVGAVNLLGMVAPGSEVVLLRPRRDDGTISSSTVANDSYNEANVYDLIPVDQFNGDVSQPLPATGEFDRFHYVRSNVAAPNNPFRAVWAGDLVLRQSSGANPEQGTLGNYNTNTATTGAQPDIAIQLANTFSDLIHPLRAGSAGNENRFPFGAFARDGDIASVPFIGHYRISQSGNPAFIYELNSVAVDATYAEDGDTGNNADEPVGRFVTMVAMTGNPSATETYTFANRLFDYLTAVDVANDATAPEEVTTPQVDRQRYVDFGNPAPTEVVAHATGALNAGSQGRININTAPWQVLAALPLASVNPAESTIDTEDKAAARTEEIAKAIVIDRQTNGPFRSIYDLNRVNVNGVRFMDAMGVPNSANFTYTHGDLSPDDGVVDDYEQRLQALTRISNLITTRSDSFTAYVLVQAWIDAGSPNAVLAAERRFVFQIDRSKMNRNEPTAQITQLQSQVP